MREPLCIYCRGAAELFGKQSWLNERGFDGWGPGSPFYEAGTPGARSVWWGEEDQLQRWRRLAEPGEWLRVKAAAVIATLRPISPFDALGLQVVCGIMWVDVAGNPEVLDLGRVLASEGPGEAVCEWSRAAGRGGEGICLLTIAVRRPVRTAFAIPFSFPEMQRILTGFLQSTPLVLCMDEPPEGVSELGLIADTHTLYELVTTPSRDTISLAFDWAARHDLQGKLLQWAREGMWEA